jgi:hypothetical protein
MTGRRAGSVICVNTAKSTSCLVVARSTDNLHHVTATTSNAAGASHA